MEPGCQAGVEPGELSGELRNGPLALHLKFDFHCPFQLLNFEELIKLG